MESRMLVIVSTPRKGGNSEVGALRVAQGFEDMGGAADIVYLREVEVAPCRACDGCKRTGQCVVDDGMQELYAKIRRADILTLSTPIYWWGVSAQLKAFMDRWYALAINADQPFQGKKVVGVFAFADDDLATPQWAKGMLETSMEYVGAEMAGYIDLIAGSVGDAARKCRDQLRQAYCLGQSLLG